jgi:hypothetical protein
MFSSSDPQNLNQDEYPEDLKSQLTQGATHIAKGALSLNKNLQEQVQKLKKLAEEKAKEKKKKALANQSLAQSFMENAPESKSSQDGSPQGESSQSGKSDKEFWDKLKQFGMAGLSAATGDPEALKTIIEVLANATHSGLEKIDLENEDHDKVRDKIEEAVDGGADKLIATLTWFQQQAGSSNEVLREKYGRKYKRGEDEEKES